MANIIKRVWRSGPRKVKRTAYGYTFQTADGQQIRKFSSQWDEDQARSALVAALEGRTTSAAPIVDSGAMSGPTEYRGLTFAAMFEKFLDQKRGEGKRSIDDDVERSRPLLAFFGKDTPLASITTRRVAEYRMARVATISRRKTKLSPATVNRECALLRSVLRMALAWDEIAKLPVFTMAKEEGRERFLTVDEITRLLEACTKSTNTMLAPLVTVAIHTGLRKGELLGLRWEQIDFSRGVIALGRRTKSGKGRDVPINQVVYQVLAPLREVAGKQEATGRVWGTIRKIDTAYNTALRRARILDPEVNFHTLRHTFASHYVMRGGSIVKLQAILGHSSVRTTQIYARLAPDHLVGATALLEGLGASVSTTSAHEPVATVATAR